MMLRSGSMFSPGDSLFSSETREKLNWLAEVAATAEGFFEDQADVHIPGVGAEVATRGEEASPTKRKRVVFFAEILSSSSQSANRWAYSVKQVDVTRDGQFEPSPNATAKTAWNTMEANNSATGVQGNGVDVGTLPQGVSLLPVGAGAVVVVHPETDCDDNATYLFEAANLVGGDCV